MWQKWGAQMHENLGVCKVGGSSLAALQKLTPVFANVRSRDVAMAINFVAKFAKLADLTIRHAVVPKRIAGSYFRFQKITWQSLLYIFLKI